jgi:hypothetical protein
MLTLNVDDRAYEKEREATVCRGEEWGGGRW